MPEGQWFDFHTGKEYTGKSWIDFPLNIENIPIFAKEGSFIPMTKSLTSTDYYKADNYVVRYYPSGKSNFMQFEDNGLDSKSLSDGKYELITYQGSSQSDKTTVNITKTGSWEGMPSTRAMRFEIRMNDMPSAVKVNGKRMKIKPEKGKPAGEKTNCTYDENWLYVNFTWDGKPLNIDITGSIQQ
jgi:oligosaccharide 4-alpha-D-glucosyltransferase